jgi:SAM-dependent methyltransferase
MLQDRPEDLRKYYDEEYRRSHGPRPNQTSSYQEIFESYVHYQTQRVDLLRPWLNPGVRLLEVGCSTGHFLYNIKGLVGEVVGVDYDSGAAKFAGNICKCTTFGCGLDETGLEHASFDVVCAIHTMEHTEDPIGFVAMLSRYLKPEGIIFIEVPSLNDPLLSIYDNSFYRDFCFQESELFYLSPRSLMTVMNRGGMDGKVYFTQCYNFLNHLHWILVGKPQPSNHEGLGSPKLPISIDEKLRGELETWLEEVDKQYKAILVKHGLTENITFIGGLSEA